MSKPDPCLDIHFLALMYLTFSHQSDGDLDSEERSVIRTKLQEWCPEGTSSSQISEHIDQAIGWYNTIPGEDRIIQMTKIAFLLKNADYSYAQRRAVLSDLVSIAKSDGNYDEVEQKWVGILAEAMEVQFEA